MTIEFLTTDEATLAVLGVLREIASCTARREAPKIDFYLVGRRKAFFSQEEYEDFLSEVSRHYGIPRKRIEQPLKLRNLASAIAHSGVTINEDELQTRESQRIETLVSEASYILPA